MLVFLLFVAVASAQWQSEPRDVHWAGGIVSRPKVQYAGLPYDGLAPVTVQDHRGKKTVLGAPLPQRGPASLTPLYSSEEASWVVAQGWQVMPINRGTLVVFPEGQEARLAWRFSVRALGGQWHVWVDASTLKILAATSESWSVDGWVYDLSPLDGSLLSASIPVQPNAVRLDGPHVWSSQCTDWTIEAKPFGERVCHEWVQSAKADPQGDFFAVPEEGSLRDPFAEVNAFYHSERFAQWFSNRFGIRAPSMQIFTGFPLTNAFYGDFDANGERDLSFGVTDDGYNFAYDSDVVVHEFGHAIVRELAGSLPVRADALGLDWTPGALNEGVADTFAMLMNPDGLLAESMARSARWDVAIRDLHPDRVCPDDLASQVHRSGQIWGSLGWNLIDDPAVGSDVTAELMVSAVSTWDDRIDWPSAAQSLIDSSHQLLSDGWLDEATHAAVLAHVEATGILDCDRIVDLERASESNITLLNLGLYADYERIPAGVQFKHALSEGADALQIRVRDFSGPENGTGLAVYVRMDAPVEHEPTRIDALGLAHAIPNTYDAVFELDEADDVLVLSADNVPGLRTDHTVHWSIASINRTRFPMDAVYVSLSLEAEAVTQPESVRDSPTSKGCQVGAMRRYNGSSTVWFVFCLSVLFRMRKYRSAI